MLWIDLRQFWESAIAPSAIYECVGFADAGQGGEKGSTVAFSEESRLEKPSIEVSDLFGIGFYYVSKLICITTKKPVLLALMQGKWRQIHVFL